MRRRRYLWAARATFMLAAMVAAGCYHTPVDTSELARGPAPLRMPSPAKEARGCSYEDSLTGGQVFSMYCSYCHNSPSLGERSFANFRNVATHMRIRANLTGKEYAKLMEFLRRWHDVPPPSPPPAPSPKRLIFSQPNVELRNQSTPPETLGNPGLAPRTSQVDPSAPAPEQPKVEQAAAVQPAAGAPAESTKP
jgi:hypothetical protein